MAYGGTPVDSAYTRRVEILSADAQTVLASFSDESGTQYMESCSFELLRQGGCGAGSMHLNQEFLDTTLQIGQHVRLSYSNGDVWYLGRIEELDDSEPSGVNVRMYGWSSYLNDKTVGGKGAHSFDELPILFANANDIFPYDPDYLIQTYISVNYYHEFVTQLYNSYIATTTPIGLGTIETPSAPVEIGSKVFRGEESLASLMRQLATAQYGASWGVDANGNFFMHQREQSSAATILAEFQAGVHTEAIRRQADRSLIINSLNIIGDYIWGPLSASRFAVKLLSGASITANGERRRTVYVPWIRTLAQAQSFANQVFSTYGNSVVRYVTTVTGQGGIIKPWDGFIRLLDKDGVEICTEEISRVQVDFDEAPIFTFHLGPEDFQFPEPPVNDRQIIPQPDQDDEPSSSGSSGSGACVIYQDAGRVVRGVTAETIDGELVAPGTVNIVDGGADAEVQYCTVEAYYRPMGSLRPNTPVNCIEWTRAGTSWWECFPTVCPDDVPSSSSGTA